MMRRRWPSSFRLRFFGLLENPSVCTRFDPAALHAGSLVKLSPLSAAEGLRPRRVRAHALSYEIRPEQDRGGALISDRCGPSSTGVDDDGPIIDLAPDKVDPPVRALDRFEFG